MLIAMARAGELSLDYNIPEVETIAELFGGHAWTANEASKKKIPQGVKAKATSTAPMTKRYISAAHRWIGEKGDLGVPLVSQLRDVDHQKPLT